MSYEEILGAADVIQGAARLPQRSRVGSGNPNHHLWNNRGTWWCHFTIHHANHTSERVRISLKTRDLAEARRRRDRVFAIVS